MNILFAPDYSCHNPYQQLLASSLEQQGCSIQFLTGYRRGLPLSRGCNSAAQLLHLHWPEAYFRSGSGRISNWIRALRYPLDLALLATRRPIVATAHNLIPHRESPLATRNMASTYRSARRIIAHSTTAADRVASFYNLDRSKFDVIPHGDLAVNMPPLKDRNEARAQLSLGDEPAGLMFGALAPYKGIEEVAASWENVSGGARLYIVGDCFDPDYGDRLEDALKLEQRVTLVRRRVNDGELGLWLSACDCTLFNYTAILTSGSACLARSLGVPIVLPESLAAVDLDEPHARVFRFDSIDGNFGAVVAEAIASRTGQSDTAEWRARTAWSRVAAETARVYANATRVA